MKTSDFIRNIKSQTSEYVHLDCLILIRATGYVNLIKDISKRTTEVFIIDDKYSHNEIYYGYVDFEDTFYSANCKLSEFLFFKYGCFSLIGSAFDFYIRAKLDFFTSNANEFGFDIIDFQKIEIVHSVYGIDPGIIEIQDIDLHSHFIFTYPNRL